jgi:hypothetical protein
MHHASNAVFIVLSVSYGFRSKQLMKYFLCVTCWILKYYLDENLRQSVNNFSTKCFIFITEFLNNVRKVGGLFLSRTSCLIFTVFIFVYEMRNVKDIQINVSGTSLFSACRRV